MNVPFKNPAEARDYLAGEIEKMMRAHGKGSPAARTRLNTLAKGLDSWGKLYRLEHDTDAVNKLAEELDELRRKILNGPEGVVSGEG